MVRSFGVTLSRTERASAAEREAYRAPLLERLLRHAATTVPFYRGRLSAALPGGSLDPARWNELPLLGRREAVAAGTLLRSQNVPPELGPAAIDRSSGSTGMPFEHLQDRLARVAAQAHTERAFRWWRVDTRKALGTLVHRRALGGKDEAAFRGWSSRHPDAPQFAFSAGTPVEAQLDWLRRRRPAYLTTYPSTLRELAKAALAADAGRIRLDLVMCVGMAVDDATREIAHSAFGAKILDTYGAQEVGHISASCPVCGRHHLSAESVFVEILDDNGRPVAPGETGEVVVTPFYSWSMPLIRYRIGDFAVAGTGEEACAVTLPALDRIAGRHRSLFRYADGSRSFPMIPLAKLFAVLPAVQFQCVQTTETAVEFRYVPDGARDPAVDAAALTALTQRHLHPTVVATAVAMDAIPRSASGKYEDFVSLVAPEA